MLVGVLLPHLAKGEFQENLKELEQLTRTAGSKVEAVVMQERSRINPAHFIGSGKVEELQARLNETNADLVVFDEDLSPAQIRNLERMFGVKIIDRSTLILDIFARHARTREAKTQVELAQLQHLLPRLTRQWSHLSRQVGGIGTRGPGETQLETDRRLVRQRIEKLRDELARIDRQRATRRKNRSNIFRISLVGYTNVGKSTIMNLLTGSELLVENQLFATLDSTVRRLELEDGTPVLLSDTVGFIRKLPAHLIASFKSTLDEVREADLLLHVVDVSHPYFREQMHAVMSVLEELGVHRKPILIAFNKIDKLSEMGIIQALKTQYRDSVVLSAVRQIGLEGLKKALLNFIEKNFISGELTVPMEHQKFIHYIHSVAVVEEQEFQDSSVRIAFRCDRPQYNQIILKYKGLSSIENRKLREEKKQ